MQIMIHHIILLTIIIITASMEFLKLISQSRKNQNKIRKNRINQLKLNKLTQREN